MSVPTPPSGDPFARAYARAGGQSPIEQANQLVAAKTALAEKRDRYSGYGIPDPGPSCAPSDPTDTITECIRAAREVLEGTIQISEIAPWTTEPFRAHSENEHVQAVLSTTAAFNPAINAAGLALQAANTVGTNAPLLLEMNSATDFRNLIRIQPSQTNMVRIKSWGISFGSSGRKSVVVRLRAATVGGQPSPPDPFLSSFPVAQQEPVFALLQPMQALQVDVLLATLVAPVLIDFGVCTYHWPVNKRKDTPRGAVLRSGFGVECSP